MNITGMRKSANIEDKRIWDPQTVWDLFLGYGDLESIPQKDPNRLLGVNTPGAEKEALIRLIMKEFPGENTREKYDIAAETLELFNKKNNAIEQKSSFNDYLGLLDEPARKALAAYFGIAGMNPLE